jgi:nitrogen-specific signal transduction histidine kinase
MREYTTVIINEADRLVGLVDALLGHGHRARSPPTSMNSSST